MRALETVHWGRLLTSICSEIRHHSSDLLGVADNLPRTILEIEVELQAPSARLVAVELYSVFNCLMEVEWLVERRLVTALKPCKVLGQKLTTSDCETSIMSATHEQVIDGK